MVKPRFFACFLHYMGMRFVLIFVAIFGVLFSNAQLSFTPENVVLGDVSEAYEIRADIIVSNTGVGKVFLLKADCDKGVKVYTSKKTLLPNDTALLVISFIPEHPGKFERTINLFTSGSNSAKKLSISGNLKHLIADNKQACYYFGKPKNTQPVKEGPMIVTNTPTKRDVSNKIPDRPSETIVSKDTSVTKVKEVEVNQSDSAELPILLYKPNNILFLVDVSNSMKDSLKLPLMKQALHTLIDAVRDIDRMTFVTYADSIKIIKENISGDRKKELHEAVDGLKAKGLTKGRQAILKSTDIVLRNYIDGGNNQIIMATDGKFNFYSEDEKQFLAKQMNKPLVLTTVGFGNDKEAIRTLRSISEKGNGSFIHIKKRTNCSELLMDEIKLRSKR